jgi:hypothetical protein
LEVHVTIIEEANFYARGARFRRDCSARPGEPGKPGKHRASSTREGKGRKKKSRKTVARKTATKQPAHDENSESGRGRAVRSFPAATFEEALTIADAIQKFAPGQQKARKLTLFDKLGKTPDSGPSRQLITNSSRYGLTKGGYQAEFIELTPEGGLATGDDVVPATKLEARFTLAIKNIEPFNFLYERCKGNKMPSEEFLMDALRETELEEDLYSECIDTFIINATFLGLLRTIAGSERLITIEHALEESGKVAFSSPLPKASGTNGPRPAEGIGDYESICFYITPIGSEDSEQRKHADFFMEYIVTPALREFNLKVVRADQIGKPGMIGKQVLEHILKSRLVIADLSFHNPNVFYELCLRHATRLPTVQIIRAAEHIPFDIEQYRTVKIDMKDLYGFLPKLQTYVSEITNQVRRTLQDADAVDNPISMFYPSVKLSWDAQ